MVHMRVNEQITWWNQCVQHVILVDEVWDIVCYGLGNTIGIKTIGAAEIKKSK